MRILLDTNLWLAILTTDGRCRQIWRNLRRSCSVYVSPEILAEIEEKLLEKFGFSTRHAGLLVAFVRRQTLPIRLTKLPQKISRDPDDDFVLATAAEAACAYLVTGDKDLLELKQFEGIEIVTPGEFAKVLV